MSALDRITIRGFKSIREADLDLRPLNVLIGANGAGKSNFIQLFSMFNAIIEERLQNFVARAGGADTLLHFGRKTTEEMRFELAFGANGYEVVLAPAMDDSLFFSSEICWFHGSKRYQRPFEVSLGRGHRETRLIMEAIQNPGKVANHVMRNIQGWRLYQFHDTSASARVKQTGDIGDNAFLRSDAGNLAAFLYRLRETQREYYDRIVKTIRLVAPFFDDFNLRPNPLNPDKMQLEWREKGSDSYFNAGMLSDGTLRFMCMATLLLQPKLPSTILIDEPELGLHPYAITTVSGLLKSAASQTQVIVATQSVPLVNQFSPEDIWVVDRVDGQSTFKRLDLSEINAWMDEYGLGDLWEKNVIGGRPQR